MIYTKTNVLLATDHVKIVQGKRGDYVEISESQINKKILKIPFGAYWRLKNEDVYYIEYITIDSSGTMVYYQKKTVKYADYKIGMYYVSLKEVIIK